ncbi:hypothetical protein KCP73_15440 [Salmonella enterica subsp. enterica]|nr:hypothetical protein KCP73_15440 [Salmonella enterica subsp. enterica]
MVFWCGSCGTTVFSWLNPPVASLRCVSEAALLAAVLLTNPIRYSMNALWLACAVGQAGLCARCANPGGESLATRNQLN